MIAPTMVTWLWWWERAEFDVLDAEGEDGETDETALAETAVVEGEALVLEGTTVVEVATTVVTLAWLEADALGSELEPGAVEVVTGVREEIGFVTETVDAAEVPELAAHELLAAAEEEEPPMARDLIVNVGLAFPESPNTEVHGECTYENEKQP
jgi:hypothetical protein